jgi:hypothetical protein
MAHYEQVLDGDVDAFIAYLDQQIPAGSITAKLEEGGDFRLGDARMVVRVYERYSALGGNRVSLCISVLAVGTQLSVSAVAAGGSQAMFWKVNTFGESAFLQRAIDAIGAYAPSL